jgi:hypothetical protein
MRYRRLLPLFILPALYVVVPGCSDDVSEFGISDARVTIAPTAKPGDAVTVKVEARNSGEAAWAPGEVTLALPEGYGFPGAALALAGDVEPGSMGTFEGKLSAPLQ